MPISPILPKRPLGSRHQKPTPKAPLPLNNELVDELKADTLQISAQAQARLSAARALSLKSKS